MRTTSHARPTAAMHETKWIFCMNPRAMPRRTHCSIKRSSMRARRSTRNSWQDSMRAPRRSRSCAAGSRLRRCGSWLRRMPTHRRRLNAECGPRRRAGGSNQRRGNDGGEERNLHNVPIRLTPTPMYGCPRSRKIFFERLGRVIGGGHVSGLEMRPVTTAGRYGDARTCCKSLERAEGSVGVLLFRIRI